MKNLRERLKPLTTKGKIDYLIEYYSFHFIGVVVLIFFLVVGFNTFTNQPKEILAIRAVGDNFHDGQAVELERELEEFKIESKRSQKELLSVSAINTSEAAGDAGALAEIQQLAAEMTAKEVDVLLLDEKTFHQFNEEGNLYDLSSINGIKDWNATTYSSDHAAITGIDVSNVSHLSSLAGSNQPLIFAVMANTERIEAVKEFIDYLY